MKTLKLEDVTAKKLYKTADPELKLILEESFGKNFFSQKITDRIKTIDDVLEAAGVTMEEVVPYRNPKNKKQKSQNAYALIQLISEVLNEDTAFPDFNNLNQYKYYPYFKKSQAGGWVVYHCNYWFDFAFGGFGGYYKTFDLALYAGNQFSDIYNDYLPL